MATTTTGRHNGHAIRAIREARRLSVAELAAEVLSAQDKPLSDQGLRNIELEHRDATAVVIERIARALDVDVLAITRGADRSRHNGFALRALRVASGLSVQDLCNTLTSAGRELSAPALRNIELEHRECRPDLIERIAKALEVDVRCLVRVPLSEWRTRGGEAA